MRAETSGNVDVHFECLGQASSQKLSGDHFTSSVRVELVTAENAKTVSGTVAVPPEQHLLCINLAGTLLARSSAFGRVLLVPPQSIAYVTGSRLIVQAARGSHEILLISWSDPATPVLAQWLAQRFRRSERLERPERVTKVVACKPISPTFFHTVRNIQERIHRSPDSLEPMLVGFLHEAVSQLAVGGDQVQLAPIPLDIPETIRELTQAVRNSPKSSWSLREAADMAGYSPFHFSRVFKTMIGYGFHEYVDRCRTEHAVQMIVNTDTHVDVVAQTSGFGSTQGLRESIKEYLGLVPSELRSVPEFTETMLPP